MTEPDDDDDVESPDPRPPRDHGQLPGDHWIIDELRRAGETVRRINGKDRHDESR